MSSPAKANATSSTAPAAEGAPVVDASTTTTTYPGKSTTTTYPAQSGNTQKFSGAPLAAAAPPTPSAKTSGMAIASLVCAIFGLIIFGIILGSVAITFALQAKNDIKLHRAIVGIFVLGVVLGPIAICLAMSAKKDIKEQPDKVKGDCMATSGLITGIIAIILSIFVIILYATGVVSTTTY